MFIQVVQDIVCPWCRIGKHNLDAALAMWAEKGGAAVDVQWFPYLLDPIEPHANENFRRRFVERKGMPANQVDTMFDRVKEVGAQDGLDFRFDRIELAQNTLAAHELVALTPVDKHSAILDGLHDAYFVNGENLEDVALLVRIAKEAGIDESHLQQLGEDLINQVRRDDVNAMIGQAQSAGISGVPFFIIDGKLSLSGAQPPAVILQALEQVANQPQAPVAG
jgi:predicted DsbA family dithiol-disulfide isomerase